MSDTRVFVMAHAQARQNAITAVREAPEGWVVQVKPPKRTLDQNAAMWPILQAFSEQLQWPVNGQMVYMTADDWKDVLSAAFRRESARITLGLDGRVVMLGLRTSKLPKSEFSAFIDFLHATASARGVVVYPEETA